MTNNEQSGEPDYLGAGPEEALEKNSSAEELFDTAEPAGFDREVNQPLRVTIVVTVIVLLILAMEVGLL